MGVRPNAPREPRVLRRQPKQKTVVVRQTDNGYDICMKCSHWTSKLVTDQTTCACCKGGHNV